MPSLEWQNLDNQIWKSRIYFNQAEVV